MVKKQEEEEIYNLAFLLFVCNDHLFWLPNTFILATVFKLSLQESYTQSQSIYSLNKLAGEKQDKHIRKNSYWQKANHIALLIYFLDNSVELLKKYVRVNVIRCFYTVS